MLDKVINGYKIHKCNILIGTMKLCLSVSRHVTVDSVMLSFLLGCVAVHSVVHFWLCLLCVIFGCPYPLLQTPIGIVWVLFYRGESSQIEFIVMDGAIFYNHGIGITFWLGSIIIDYVVDTSVITVAFRLVLFFILLFFWVGLNQEVSLPVQAGNIFYRLNSTGFSEGWSRGLIWGIF